jgi:hypothetical protein
MAGDKVALRMNAKRTTAKSTRIAVRQNLRVVRRSSCGDALPGGPAQSPQGLGLGASSPACFALDDRCGAARAQGSGDRGLRRPPGSCPRTPGRFLPWRGVRRRESARPDARGVWWRTRPSAVPPRRGESRGSPEGRRQSPLGCPSHAAGRRSERKRGRNERAAEREVRAAAAIEQARPARAQHPVST